MQTITLKLIIGIITMSILTALISACSSAPKKPSYASSYLEALENRQGETVSKQAVEGFSQLFSDLKQEDLQAAVRNAYSDDFYFNDTFRSIDNIDDLVDYFLETSDNINATKVYIEDIVQSDRDFYVRWVMDIDFETYNKKIVTRSIGMSHLRFNTEGKIILHQDFWDNTDAFFRHLPIVGPMITRVQKRL